MVRVSLERMSSSAIDHFLRGSQSGHFNADPDRPVYSQGKVPDELDLEHVAELMVAMDRSVAMVEAQNRAIAEAMMKALCRQRR